MDALRIVSKIDPLVLTNLVAMPPLKITQETAAHLLFTKVNQTWEYGIISKPMVGNNKLYLASTNLLFNVTNIDLGNSKAVKSDDALTGKIMWNISALMNVSGR